jgi:putative RecB family exonuclease
MSTALNQLPDEQVHKRLHISYSQVRTFLICPQKYSYQYILGAEWERKSAALALGSAVHKAVEAYYRSFQESGEILPLDRMVAVFDKVLEQQILNSETKIIFKDGESLAMLRKQGAALLEVFHAEVAPNKIVAVEVPFSVKIPDLINGNGFLPVRLEGIFDLVEADYDGTYLVCELKTSGQRFSALKLEHDLQSTVYSYAMAQMGFATSEHSTLVRYDVLLKQKKPALERYYVSRATDDHRRLVQLLNQVCIELLNWGALIAWMDGSAGTVPLPNSVVVTFEDRFLGSARTENLSLNKEVIHDVLGFL